MFASDTPNSATEQKRAEQLDVAHVPAVQVFTLCDIRGKLILPHDPRPEHDAPEIASRTHVPTANGHDTLEP
jgi:hypothetical protein